MGKFHRKKKYKWLLKYMKSCLTLTIVRNLQYFIALDGPKSKHLYQADGPKSKNVLTLLAGLWETHTLLVGVQISTTFMGGKLALSVKIINAYFIFNSAVLLVETYPIYTCAHMQKYIYSKHSLHQLVRAKDWKQAKCPLKGDWLINDNTSNIVK